MLHCKKLMCFCLFKLNYKLIVMNQRHFTHHEKHKTNWQSVLFSICVLAFSEVNAFEKIMHVSSTVTGQCATDKEFYSSLASQVSYF